MTSKIQAESRVAQSCYDKSQAESLCLSGAMEDHNTCNTFTARKEGKKSKVKVQFNFRNWFPLPPVNHEKPCQRHGILKALPFVKPKVFAFMKGKAASTHCHKMFRVEKPKTITKGSFVLRAGQTIQLHLHKLGEFFWVLFLHSRNSTFIWVNTPSILTIIKLPYTIINFNALRMQTLLFLPTRSIDKTFPWKLPLSLWGFVFNYSSARAYCSSPT